MKELRCASCSALSCQGPGTEELPSYCPMAEHEELLAEVERLYLENRELRDFALAAARTEAGGYCVEPRVEEIISFARRIGAKRIGIANCVGLMREARMLAGILEASGLEPLSVCCKVGSIDKQKLGLRDDEQIRPGGYEPLCNPVAQARLLDGAGAELNVVVGLCVGHDSLFFQHSRAPVTVLVAKDRVTGHNPAAALYTSHSYYKRLKGK